jgi:AcrR family transcriptional regulator
MDLAEAHIRDAGYGGFGFRDLAAEIGIKSASVHHHFPTKAILAAAVARRYGDRFLAAVAPRPNETGKDAVSAYRSAFRKALERDGRMCHDSCPTGAAQIHYERFVGFYHGVAAHRHWNRLARLAGRECQLPTRRRVVTARHRTAVSRSVIRCHCTATRGRQRHHKGCRLTAEVPLRDAHVVNPWHWSVIVENRAYTLTVKDARPTAIAEIDEEGLVGLHHSVASHIHGHLLRQ